MLRPEGKTNEKIDETTGATKRAITDGGGGGGGGGGT